MERIRVWIQSFKGRKDLRLQWIDPLTGKRRTVSADTDDAQKAEQARADKEYELNHGLHVEPSKMTWERFREIYIEEKWAGAPENAIGKVEYVFRSFDERVSPKNLGSVNERLISRYATILREEGKSAATIHGYLAYLKAALRWGHKQGIVTKVPNIVMPKLPKGNNRTKIRNASRLTTEEYERLLAKCPNDGWKLLVSFAWHCGMRRCEAMAVHGEHIDLENHSIELPRNKAQDMAATAFITPDLDAMLRSMFPAGIPNGPIVKGVPTSDQKVSRNFVHRISTPAAVKGNSKHGYATLHDLRRAYGSRWMLKVPAQVLQRMMRHANISTTLDFYADAEKAAVDAIWNMDK